MYIIEAKDVVKEYILGKVTVSALRKLNLKIAEGEILCIMGPSGSGKTTLLNMIGLLDFPTQGEIILEGTPTHHHSYQKAAELRSRYLGFIFQSFNLFPVLNVAENIEYPMLFLPISKKVRSDRIDRALKDVQLQEVAFHRPDELSGGQRQRVAIARALVTHPALILADEPTANLDSHTAEAIMSVMQNINQNYKTTFVFSTHDPRVTRYATRIVRLCDGVIEDESV
jgi:putative ABC transport system ATP-binding protein